MMRNNNAREKIGSFHKMPAAPVKTSRSRPGDLNAARAAAYYYAKAAGRDMMLVPGNSYGHAVYHVANADACVRTYVPNVGPDGIKVEIVNPEGEIFVARAS